MYSRTVSHKKSLEKKNVLCVTGLFVSYLFLLYYRYSKDRVDIPHRGLLSRQELLDRKLLFHDSVPNVRSTSLKMFDSEGLIVTIERLVAEKMNKKLGEDPLYSDFEEIEAKRVDMRKTVHVSFVGDSRIRQIFTTFMTAIPDYDRLVHPLSVRHGIEGQAAVSNEVLAYSKLQGLVSSLYSRALLVDKKVRKLSDFLKVWLKSDIKDSGNYSHIVTPHPDILVIGVTPHHMLKENMVFERVFFEALIQLVPILQEISKNCQIIWLNQYPTQELYGNITSHNTDVHASKIWHYNQGAEKILKAGGIAVWNSGSPIVEEYFRGCKISQRQDGVWRNFFDCKDYIHPGTSALTDMIQILFNVVLPTDNQS